MPGIGVEFPSYVYDLYCGLYDGRASYRRMEGLERREAMEDLVDRVSVILKEVAAEHGLPWISALIGRLGLLRHARSLSHWTGWARAGEV